jgi:hypothetical protein
MYNPNLQFAEDILIEDYILTMVLPDWEKYVEQIKLAEEWFIKNDMITADGYTNVKSGFHTPYRSQIHGDWFDDLHNAIRFQINYAQHKYRGIKKTALWDQLKPGDCWIAKYQKGDSTAQHVHYPYHMVSTFYYDVEVSTPIIFEYYNEHGLEHKSVEVANGMILVQNAAVVHSVPEVKGPRSVFATNWYYDIRTYLENSDKEIAEKKTLDK